MKNLFTLIVVLFSLSSLYSQSWNLAGNNISLTPNAFLGTTNNSDLTFKRNSILAGRIGNTNTSFGREALDPTAPLGIHFYNNTALGVLSLKNTLGNNNTALGFSAGTDNTSGNNNIFIGSNTGNGFTTDSNTVIIGNSISKTSLGSGGSFSNYVVIADGSGNIRLTVKSDGKTLIGNPANTTTPGNYKLFVEEGILTEKVKVALSTTADWADYVFEKDYKLMSLKEIESFIKENGHLPGISSAEELLKEGIDLGQMQAKLLEKIEELTLYAIEKEKKIQNLEKDLELLKEQMKLIIEKQ